MAQAKQLIAIIDDDASLRTALAGLARSLGYRVSAFACAEDFLAANIAAESACIISDIQMPGLSGIELKDWLGRAGCAAPMIMITARTEPGLQEKALAAGALCVLQKPFAAEDLIASLDRALASRTPPG